MKTQISDNRILISWIGKADLKASEMNGEEGLGPVAQALSTRNFDFVILMCNYAKEKGTSYVCWLEKLTPIKVELYSAILSSPTNHAEIYQFVIKLIQEVLSRFKDAPKLTYHLSPGTPAMASIWVLIAKTRYAAELIESSVERGVSTVSIPFDISAEFIPDLLKGPDSALSHLTAGVADETSVFDGIIHRSPVMRQVINMARQVAPRSIPVLIEGESGTGKEMLARAIHNGSRRNAAFIAVNCGAIVKELAESEFFGHKKHSFTGAVSDREGHFELANGGTIFLDEIGELPLDIQVKLLRVIQEKKVVRVGDSKPIDVDFRIIAATNRTLTTEVEAGRFREDLFYRLAVAVIRIPSLKDRPGDLTPLIDNAMIRINKESSSELTWEEKTISVGGINILMHHPWPGNVRELVNTLTRATVWTSGNLITEEDIKNALLNSPLSRHQSDGILNRSISEPIDLEGMIGQVAKHYILRVLKDTNGNKSKAAEMLGLNSYQTLDNWIKKYVD